MQISENRIEIAKLRVTVLIIALATVTVADDGACGAGSYLNDGVCLNCVAGKYLTGIGSVGESSCELCAPGTFQTGTGMQEYSDCANCSIGFYSNGGSSVCMMCPAGTYSKGFDDFISSQQIPLSGSMVSASFYLSNSAKANLVDGNTALSAWTTDPYVLVSSCAETVYVQVDLGKQMLLSQVIFWNYYDGRQYCNISVQLSSSCMFAGEEIVVFSCGAFSSCPELTSAGFLVSFSLEQARCVRWTSSRSNSNSGVHFLQLEVFEAACCCVNCDSGTYQTGLGMVAEGECILCGPGKYQTGSGIALEASCTACNAGTYQSGFGISSAIGCTLCAAGTYQPALGISNQSACINCSLGNYSPDGSGSCSACDAGKYWDGQSDRTLGSQQISLNGNMVSASFAVSSSAKAALVGGNIALSSWTSAPYTTENYCWEVAYVQVDMGVQRQLSKVMFWNYYDGRQYCNISIQLSSTCLFQGEQSTVFACTTYSSCPAVTVNGFSVVFSPTLARCVRWSSSRYNLAVYVQFLQLKVFETTCCCTFCAAGFYQTGTGMVSVTNCSLCGAGRFQTGSGIIGGSNCSQCTPGTFQTGLAGSSCVFCWPGTYETGFGQISGTNCSLCGPGKYNTGSGLVSEKNCSYCPAGTYQTGSGQLAVINCTACGPGTYQTGVGLISETNCSACWPGSFQSGYGNGMAIVLPLSLSGSMVSASFPVSNGAKAAMVGGNTALSSWTSAPNTDENTCVETAYVEVDLGQIRLLSEITFWSYYDGRIQCNVSIMLSSSCLFAGEENTVFSCSTYSSCPTVTANGYRVNFNPSEARCVRWVSSRSNLNAGIMFLQLQLFEFSCCCTSCAAGTYQTGRGLISAGNCSSCTAGKYSTGSGYVSDSNCTECRAGTYQSGYGLISSSNCSRCGPGTFQTGLGLISASNCSACSPGSYQTGFAITSPSNCSSCVPGTYLTGIGATSDLNCSLCEPGKYQSGVGAPNASECADCSEGLFSWAGATACSFCASGTYSGRITAASSSSKVQLNESMVSASWAMSSNAKAALFSGNTALSSYIAGSGASVTTCSDIVYVQVDMGRRKLLSQIIFWNYYIYRFCNISIQLSSSCLFAGEQITVFACSTYANCPTLTAEGYQIRFEAIQAQCVRWSSSRNNISAAVQFLQLQLFDEVCCCVSCPAGSYQTGVGMINCSQCNTGKYSTGTGSSTDSACVLCRVGTFQTGYGLFSATNCSSCNPGTYQASPGQSTCTACNPGKYLIDYGLASSLNCTVCSSGTHQSGFGFSVCSLCSQGTYQTGRGTSNCSLCSAGTFQSGLGLSNCSVCEAGTFQTGSGLQSAEKCSLCQTGTYQSGLGQTSQASCILCGAGTFQSGTGISVSSDCRLCGPGTFQTGSGLSFAADCSFCAAGTYQSGSGLLSSEGCNLCAAGFYQTGSGFSSLNDCIPCDPGTFQTGKGLPSKYNCSLCGAGTFQTGSAMNSAENCSLCRTGTYQTGFGMSSDDNCSYCGPGTYQTGLGLPNATYCSLCGAGKFQTGTGLSFSSNCSLCGYGKFQADFKATSSAACIDCLPGLYSNISGASACLFCQASFYSNSAGATECLDCPSDDVAGSSSCAFCPPGTYNTTQSLLLTVCASEGELCACNGTVILESGGGWLISELPFSVICKRTGFPGPANDSRKLVCRCLVGCSLCAPGKFSTATAASSSATCIPCRAGKYGSSFGQSNCSSCPSGQYNTGQGLIGCIKCAEGKFFSGSGASNEVNCTSCAAGSSSAILSASSCEECAAGRFQTGTGTTRCVMCGAGKYSARTGGSAVAACVDCPGILTSFSGSGSMWECFCPSGYFNQSSNSTSQCADVDECAHSLSVCGPLRSCVNTVGSFVCSLNLSLSSSACPDPYPPTCSVEGGDVVWISVPKLGAGTVVNATIQFAAADSTAVIRWVGSWAQASCLPSTQTGLTTATLAQSDGSVICKFAVVYMPPAASANPASVPLMGGLVQINLTGWVNYLEPSLCQVLVGGDSAGFVNLVSDKSSLFYITAPPRGSSGLAAVDMECRATAGRVDIGLSLLYLEPARAAVNGGQPCVQFEPCKVFLTVSNFPCPIRNSGNLALVADGRFFDISAVVDGNVSAILQVRSSIALFSLTSKC